MSKNIKRNTRALQTTYDNYKNRLTQGTRAKIQNLISFYEDRKIAQFTTADNLIRQFITAKTDKQKAKANTAYDKIHDKHHDKEPLGQRMREAKKENKRRNTTSIYSIDVMFYKLKLDKDDAIKTAFKDSKDGPLIYFWKEPKSANVKSTRYIEDLVGKRIFRYEKETKNIFKKLMGAFNTDPVLEDDLFHTEQYMECIQIKSLERVGWLYRFQARTGETNKYR